MLRLCAQSNLMKCFYGVDNCTFTEYRLDGDNIIHGPFCAFGQGVFACSSSGLTAMIRTKDLKEAYSWKKL